MFENKAEVQKVAKSMGIKIMGMDDIPEIKMSPVLFENGDDLFQANGMKLTYSQFDDGRLEALAKVSDQYSLVQHYDAVGQVLLAFKDLPEFSLNKVTVKHSENGGRCWAEFGSSNAITMAPGDDIFPRITLTNSCDTSKRFWLNWGAVRQICTNGMMGPDDRIAGGTVKKLHKLGTLSIADEIEQFKKSFVTASESLGIWKEYAKLELKRDHVLEIYQDMSLSEKQVETIMNLPLRGDNTTVNAALASGKINGWLAYNAVSQWITDETDNPATAMIRGTKASQAFDKLL